MIDDNLLTFKSIVHYSPGILFSLLQQSYRPIWNDKLENSMINFDKEVFSHPDTIGLCTFISVCDGEVIGFASYDPRQEPELVMIGHNCILPPYRRKVYGKQQIREIFGRLVQRQIKKAAVSTGTHPFFIPAQKMYLSCGFREISRQENLPGQTEGKIYYEMNLATYKNAEK